MRILLSNSYRPSDTSLTCFRNVTLIDRVTWVWHVNTKPCTRARKKYSELRENFHLRIRKFIFYRYESIIRRHNSKTIITSLISKSPKRSRIAFLIVHEINGSNPSESIVTTPCTGHHVKLLFSEMHTIQVKSCYKSPQVRFVLNKYSKNRKWSWFWCGWSTSVFEAIWSYCTYTLLFPLCLKQHVKSSYKSTNVTQVACIQREPLIKRKLSTPRPSCDLWSTWPSFDWQPIHEFKVHEANIWGISKH